MGPPGPRQRLPLRGELRGRHPGTDSGAVQETKAERERCCNELSTTKAVKVNYNVEFSQPE